MAVTVNRFLGRDLIIPEDRLYWPEEGVWISEVSPGVQEVGLTEPAVLMAGGVREIEPLVEANSTVRAGDTVCLVLTSKLKYLSAPLPGAVTFAAGGGDVESDPYGTAIFQIQSASPKTGHLTDASGYAAAISHSEGAHNPDGAKGGISATCKSVYGALRQQKMQG